MFFSTTGFITTTPLPIRSHSRRSVCSVSTRMTAATASYTVNGVQINGPLQPTGQNILVKIAEAAETTAGGLFLSGSAKEKPTYGEAIEVGPGKYFGSGTQIPMDIEKGDTVLYGKYGGTDIQYNDEKHCIVTQDDILCKLKGGIYSAENVEPIFDRVLIKVDKPSEETNSGIVLSKTAQEKSNYGKVVAMGNGRFMENGQVEPPAFNIGDTVMYGKYSGSELELDGDDYMLIRAADVYAKY